jgi:hypothetical protein
MAISEVNFSVSEVNFSVSEVNFSVSEVNFSVSEVVSCPFRQTDCIDVFRDGK